MYKLWFLDLCENLVICNEVTECILFELILVVND
jgi:hypothetical protein